MRICAAEKWVPNISELSEYLMGGITYKLIFQLTFVHLCYPLRGTLYSYFFLNTLRGFSLKVLIVIVADS